MHAFDRALIWQRGSFPSASLDARTGNEEVKECSSLQIAKMSKGITCIPLAEEESKGEMDVHTDLFSMTTIFVVVQVVQVVPLCACDETA